MPPPDGSENIGGDNPRKVPGQFLLPNSLRENLSDFLQQCLTVAGKHLVK